MTVQKVLSRAGIRADLDPIKIPVIDDGGHGGIGHDDLNDPEDGLVLSVNMGPNFFEGDFIKLFWEDVEVQAFPITAEHYQHGIIGFSVLPRYIIKPNVDVYTAKIYYIVSDASSGTSARLDPPREALVKNTVPGNPDPIPDTPYLNENLHAPAGVPSQIKPPVKPVTLTIEPWDKMHEDDQLTVYWGSTQNKVTQPIVGLGRPQTVTVPAEVIESGGDSTNLRVLYSIRDFAGNWSLYSEAALTNVAIDPSKPSQPRVLDDGRPTLRIDLDTPGTHTITVEIPAYVNASEITAHGADTQKGRMALGDEITLTWAGETADGIPLVYTPPSQPVTDTGFGPVFDIPDDNVTKIANGFATVSYEVDPADGTANRFSRSTTVTVVRKQVEELIAPELLDAKGGTTVDPADVPATGASVNIPHYTGKQFGDIIYLLWEGKNSLGDPVVYENDHSVLQNEETLPYVFTVDKSQVDRLIDGSLKLSYSVKFFASVTLPSAPSSYTVVGQGLLEKPSVDHVDADGVLDPELYPTTSVRIDGTKAMLKIGDTVTAYWVGAPGPGTGNQPFRVGGDNQNLVWPITNALIAPNRDLSVQVRYIVVRAAGGQQNSGIQPIQIKVAATGPVTGDESFEAQPLRALPLNTPLQFANNLTITVSGAAGTATVTPGINEFGNVALYCAGDAKIKFEFGGNITSLAFSHAITDTAFNTLEFFNAAGGSVSIHNLSAIPVGSDVKFEDVSLPSTSVYCELTVDNIGTMLDNLIWT
ncbi:hypothetical protein [Pseudomonas caspiana]|uniref:hypothetical protein n=1 Tax=Pseudomonas caspiana TaxID=1451454 RepID=UPI0032F06D12